MDRVFLAGGFCHECPRLKSFLSKAEALLKALVLKHSEYGLNSFFNTENIILMFIKLFRNVISYNFLVYCTNCHTKVSHRP